jgi:hypothetical protein
MAKDKVDKKQMEKAEQLEKEEQSKYKISISKVKQQELVDKICYLVDKDEADRKEFIQTRQECRDLYEGKRPPKSDPWPNCANVSTQIITMVVEILHSRLFPSVWNENLIYWKPMEKTDLENVENISKFMKWVIKDMGMREVMDDFVHNLILDGTAILKIRWTPEWKWVQRKLPKKDFSIKRIKNVMMQWFGGKKKVETEEQLYDITYEYKKFEKCRIEVIDLEDVGFPLYSVPSAREEELEYIWHKFYPTYETLLGLQDKGVYENVDDIGDNLEEGIRIEGTKKSDIDAEHTKVTQNKYNQQLECVEMYMKYEDEDIIVTIDKKTKTFLGAKSIFSISKIGEKPFVIGQLIRRTNRMLGKSIAEIVMPHQKEMDAIHNQRLDAGTMAINPIGIYRAGSGFEPEKVDIEPGLWLPVDDINDAKWIVVPNNVMVSFQEEKMLMELIEKITSVGAYQSGQESDVIRSRATARGTMAIIQQGEVRFNILGKRIQSTLSRALNKILRQYQEKIPPGMAMRVLGIDGEQLFPENIAPEDLAGNYDSYLVMDSTGGSKDVDRQVKATAYQFFMQNPFVANNPAGMWQLTSDTAKSMGIENVEEIIGQKPVGPPITKTVQEENYLAMQGRPIKISDTDNVVEHLIGHMMFRGSLEFAMMPPEYIAAFDEHLSQTKLQLARGVIQSQMGDSAVQAPPQQPMNPMALQQGGMGGNQAGAGMGLGEQPGMAANAPTAPVSEIPTGAGVA